MNCGDIRCYSSIYHIFHKNPDVAISHHIHVVEHTTWDLRTAPTDPRNEPKWLRNGCWRVAHWDVQLPGVPAAVSAAPASAPAAGASAAPATLRRVLLRIWQSQSVANATEIRGDFKHPKWGYRWWDIYSIFTYTYNVNPGLINHGLLIRGVLVQ
jgi:hypothetical protein